MEVIQSDLYSLYPGLEEAITTSSSMTTPREASEHFNKAFDAVGNTEKGWSFEVREGGAAAETHASRKIISCGENRSGMTPSGLKKLVSHEVFHSVRAQNASEQKEAYKRRAFPGNLAFEEGFCTAIEQVLSGETRDVGAQYYISLGLQMGLDREQPEKRDLRQTYEILWRRLLLDKPVVSVDDIAVAKKKALTQAVRTARGNSLDARDISYAVGSQKANLWLNQIADLPENERKQKLIEVLSAKFDPTNPDQAKLFMNDSRQGEMV